MSQNESLNEAGTESIAYVEALYADFLRDPNSVSGEWRDHFTDEAREAGVPSNLGIGPSFRPSSIYNPPNATCKGGACATWQISVLQERVGRLVHAFRVRGHLLASIDPLGRPRWRPPELEHDYHGLSKSDLERGFAKNTISGVDSTLTLAAKIGRAHV